MLHRPKENKGPKTTSTGILETHASVSLNTFDILPVELSNNGKSLKVFELVVSGSSLSWLDRSSADQLNLQGVKQCLTVSGISDTEFHDSDLVKVAIPLKNWSEDTQMAIHQNLVIDDSFFDIPRTQTQYLQLIKVSSTKFNLKDVKVIFGTGCFSLTRPSEY